MEKPLTFNSKSLIKLLVHKDDPVVLEIGCNNGMDSLEFLETFSKIRLFCFEPDVRAIQKWKHRVADPRAELIEMAVGDFDGLVDFYESGGIICEDGTPWDQSGSITKPTGHLKAFPYVTFPNKRSVAITKLDSWSKRFSLSLDVDFIWADVQGAEAQLVRGGRDVLSRTWFFFTESYPVPMYDGQVIDRDLVRLLPDFVVLAKIASNLLFKAKRFPGPNNFDELMTLFCGAGLPRNLLPLFSSF